MTVIASNPVPLVDLEGHAFELVRSLDLELAVWRVQTPEELGDVAPGTVVMFAAQSADELERGYALMRRHPTVVLGFGLGPRHWSRAMNLGAAGYVHDDRNASLGEDLREALRRASRAPRVPGSRARSHAAAAPAASSSLPS